MQHTMMVNGVMNLVPLISFRAVVANLKVSPLRLRKHAVAELALPPLTEMAQLLSK